MTATLLDTHAEKHVQVDRAAIQQRLSAEEFFWLDLEDAGPDDLALLRDVFRFHPLAMEDSEQFGQRPKLEEYDDFVFFVVDREDAALADEIPGAVVCDTVMVSPERRAEVGRGLLEAIV